MTPLNFSKAGDLVAVYLTALQDKSPMQLGRTWLETRMGQVGFAPEYHSQKWQFGESHAAWYAALIVARSIGKVAKAESTNQRPSQTAKTIKKLLKGHLRNTVTAMHLERILNQVREGKAVQS